MGKPYDGFTLNVQLHQPVWGMQQILNVVGFIFVNSTSQPGEQYTYKKVEILPGAFVQSSEAGG